MTSLSKHLIRRTFLTTPSFVTTNGFTLPELLISLALIGMLTVLLYGALHIGVRSWDSIEIYSERTEGLRLARGFLQRCLRQAVAAQGTVKDEQILLFTGDAEQLEFVAPLSGFLGMGGLYLLRFSLVKLDKDTSLVVQRWLVHPDVFGGKVEGIPEWKPLERPRALKVPYDSAWGIYGTSLLLPASGPLIFSYFGPTKDKPEAEWQEDWKERNELPILIKISLGANVGWADLVVALAGDKVAVNQNLNSRITR